MFRPLALALAIVSPAAAADGLTITDAAGKEIVLKKWQISAGARKLAWLGKDGAAPEALAFRETNSTMFREGVLTLIPLDRLESLTYDGEKQTVQAKIAGIDKLLEGSTRFQGINQVTIEAELDKGDAGIIEVKYRGGIPKSGVKSIKFPSSKAGEEPKGDKFFVTVADGKKKEAAVAVYQLQALYRTEKDAEKLAATITFKKTFKVELSQIKKMTIREEPEQKSFECDVMLADGSEQTLTLLTTVPMDGKNATLEGFVGQTPAGWKLFPVHTVGEIGREEPKAEK